MCPFKDKGLLFSALHFKNETVFCLQAQLYVLSLKTLGNFCVLHILEMINGFVSKTQLLYPQVLGMAMAQIDLKAFQITQIAQLDWTT